MADGFGLCMRTVSVLTKICIFEEDRKAAEKARARCGAPGVRRERAAVYSGEMGIGRRACGGIGRPARRACDKGREAQVGAVGSGRKARDRRTISDGTCR